MDKFVFHIPLYKYVNGELIAIDIDDVLNDLFDDFKNNGHGSAYFTNVKSLYKSKIFDEVLITIFTSSEAISKKTPENIFKEWFIKNNNVLQQEAFAYECGNSMFIEDL